MPLNILRRSIPALLVALFITACGGGGGTTTPPPATTSLSGTAAVGFAVANGTVNIKCASSTSIASSSTNASGAIQVTLTAQTLPCAIQVSGGTINGAANTTNYHTIAISAGNVNATPLTDLLIANLAGTATPDSWFASLTTTQLVAITAGQVTVATTNALTALGLTAQLAGIDPITTVFTPTSDNVMDNTLEALQAAITGTGTSYASLLAGAGASANAAFTTPAGFNTALANAYVPPAGGGTTPTVTSFTPTTGAVSTSMTITGTNLGSVTDVLFTGPSPGTAFASGVIGAKTATSITTAVPASLATGSYAVSVVHPGGEVAAAGSFTVTAAGGGVAAWTATGSLAVAHYQSSTTLLADGKVLVAGGSFNAAAERYDPATGLWSSAGNLAIERSGHDATLLADGKVLITGGSVTAGAATATTERYDPTTNQWSATGSFAATRQYHSALLLGNGKVLAVGGMVAGTWSASAELYDPTTGLWSATGSLSAPRSSHTITLLTNGKVLMAGGTNPFGGTLPSAELYDPATGLWTPTSEWSVTGNLLRVRYGHTATLLSDGKVLVAGGSANAGAGLALTELYDPATNQWTPQGAVPAAGRRTNHTATLLSNGNVLLSGGQMGGGRVAVANLYDPATGLWTETGGNMLTNSRLNHIAILLANGKVLVTGGTSFIGTSGYPDQLNSAVMYDPATALWITVGNFVGISKVGSATLLTNGKVIALAEGSSNLDVYSELYY